MTEERICPNCNKLIVRKRNLGNGKIESSSTFKRRQFCDHVCHEAWKRAKLDAEKATCWACGHRRTLGQFSNLSIQICRGCTARIVELGVTVLPGFKARVTCETCGREREIRLSTRLDYDFSPEATCSSCSAAKARGIYLGQILVDHQTALAKIALRRAKPKVKAGDCPDRSRVNCRKCEDRPNCIEEWAPKFS